MWVEDYERDERDSVSVGESDAAKPDPLFVSWAMASHPEDCGCSTCVSNRAFYGHDYADAKRAHKAAYLADLEESAE